VLVVVASAWQVLLVAILLYAKYGMMGEDRAGNMFAWFQLVWISLVITVPSSAVALVKASYAHDTGAMWFYLSAAALPFVLFGMLFLT